MSTQTSSPAAAPVVQTEAPAPTAARDAAVTRYTELRTAYLAAREAGNTTEYRSLDAKLANQSRRIREAELDLALSGVAFTAWKKSTAGNSKSSKTKTHRPEAEIRADVAKVAAVYKNQKHPASTRKSAAQRIGQLLTQATAASYKIADPRKPEDR